MKEITFALIKPDAVSAKKTGNIIEIIEENGFEIVGMKKQQLTEKEASAFYDVHNNQPFFQELIDFITSGPIVAMALEREDAISQWRDLMGETDSKKAAKGTIRNLFGTDKGKNAVHGSDAPETAKNEVSLFFPNLA